jgi:hypothetical protein
MIINRTRPNTHKIESTTFHPGAQFIPDEVYNGNKEKGVIGLKDNSDFKEQLKVGFLVIDVKPEEKPEEGAKKQSLADAVAVLKENEALDVISKTCDAVDLKEISARDKRRSVRTAADTQITDRQKTLNGMAPKIPAVSGGPGNPIKYNKTVDKDD